MIKWLVLFAVLAWVGALIFSPISAFAQVAAPAAGGVSIPWGAWLADGLASAASLAVTALGYVIARWAPAWVKSFLTDKVINDAINYGFGAVEGVVKGGQLTVASTNAILNAAASYAITYEPSVAHWLGATLRPVILAKLSAQGVVPATVSASSVGATILAPK